MSNFFDLSHVGGFPIAGGDHIDQYNECPHHKCNCKHIILVESGKESHEVNLNSKNHINFCISGVCWKGTDTELNDANRCNAQQNNIEQEAIHPCLVLFHGMESTATRYSDSKFNIALLNCP